MKVEQDGDESEPEWIRRMTKELSFTRLLSGEAFLVFGHTKYGFNNARILLLGVVVF